MSNYSNWLYGNKPIPWNFMEQPQAPNLSMEPTQGSTGGLGDMLKGLSVAKVGDVALKNALPLAIAGRMITSMGGAGNTPLTRTQDMVINAAKGVKGTETLNKGYTLPKPRSATTAAPNVADPLATTTPEKKLDMFDWSQYWNKK